MRRNGFITGLLYVLMVFLAVGLGVLIFFNYQANTEQMTEIAAAEAAAAVTPTPAPTETPTPTATPSRTTETVTLAFAGDIVGQAGLTTDAAESDGDTTVYDYTDELAGVSVSLEGADLAACTLVGTLSSGTDYEGYRMNAAMADAIVSAGFSLVNAATDHILDDGLDGLSETVSLLKDTGMGVIGAYNNEISTGLLVANVGDIQVAFLSYTYGTGGVSVADNSWCINLMTTDYMTNQETVDYDQIDADIAAVKEAGADIVVCFLYWWDNTQYYTVPRDNQTEVVDYLCENGVDIIIGGGVKAPQPIEVRTVAREDGNANCVICYSLSNLMSCFNDNYTNLSATARIEISQDVDTGEVWVSGVSYYPLFMLDTDDYSDYTDPEYKYRLLDAYSAIEDYETGASDAVSEETYQAILTGVSDLQTLLGEDYDIANGGVALDFPYTVSE